LAKRTRAVAEAQELDLDRAAAFRSALRQFLGRTEVVAGQAGLTSQRYDLLLMIRAGSSKPSGLRVTDLTGLLHLRQTAVTENLKRAVAAGLVERYPSDTDGRVSLLKLTPEGEQRLMRTFNALHDDREALAAAFKGLQRSFRAAGR
jgi:DNA-binding MarR family transcriptional regulator